MRRAPAQTPHPDLEVWIPLRALEPPRPARVRRVRGRIAQLQPLVRAERDRGGEREGRAAQLAGPRCADVRRGAGARFGGEEAAGAGAGEGRAGRAES